MLFAHHKYKCGCIQFLIKFNDSGKETKRRIEKSKKNKRIHKQTTAGVKYNNLWRRTNTSNQSGYN